MLRTGEFIKAASVAAILSATAFGAAQTRYVPQDGDIVEVYRHPFGLKNLATGKAEMMKIWPSLLTNDKLVRLSVLAEDPKTGEVISITFSDPFNVSAGTLRPQVQSIYRLYKKPRTKQSFRIYAHNDESHVPAAGDHLILWWRNVVAKDHTHMRGLVMSRVIDAAKKDSQNRDSYFLENDTPGQFLNLAISAPASGSENSIRSAFANIDARLLSPLKIEHYRVFFVRHENKT